MKEYEQFKPRHDKYLAAKFIGNFFPFLFGERGKVFNGLYQWGRWVDNCVDEDRTLSKEQKLAFLDRQLAIVLGDQEDGLEPVEKILQDVPWNHFPKQTKTMILVCLAAVREDIADSGFVPRLERQARHNHWRTLYSTIEVMSLIINGRPLRPTAEFMSFIDNWNKLGNLAHLKEDLEYGIFKIGLNRNEVALIITQPPEKRLEAILTLFNKKRFQREKIVCLQDMARNSLSFLRLNMPLWQRILCLLYVGEVIAKRLLTTRYPEI